MPDSLKLELEEIPLKEFPESVIVSLIQFESPFDNIIESTWTQNGQIFAIGDETRAPYQRHINDLLGIIHSVIIDNSEINVIIIPEYSFVGNDEAIRDVSKSTFDELCDISKNNGIVLIGNYYDQVERLSKRLSVFLLNITNQT